MIRMETSSCFLVVIHHFMGSDPGEHIFSDIHRIMKQFETLLNKGYQQNLQTQHIYVVSEYTTRAQSSDKI